MKHLTFLFFFMMINFTIFSQEKLLFNNYSFGTSYDIIREKERPLVSENRILNTSQGEGAYQGLSTNTVANYRCQTFYIFENSKLIAGYYSIITQNDYIAYGDAYNDLKNRLIRVYGNPVAVDESVPMDSFRNKMVTKWNIVDDVIELQYYSTRPQGEWIINLVIYYKSKKYIENEIREEQNRRENIQGL